MSDELLKYAFKESYDSPCRALVQSQIKIPSHHTIIYQV